MFSLTSLSDTIKIKSFTFHDNSILIGVALPCRSGLVMAIRFNRMVFPYTVRYLSGDVIIRFSDDILRNLNWKVNDELVWTLEDNTLTFEKV